MPEGPELRHSRDHLRQVLCGRHYPAVKFEILGGRYVKEPFDGYEHLNERLNRSMLTDPYVVYHVDTKGKLMWWTLASSRDKFYFWTTYGMSGAWMDTPTRHSAVSFEYSPTLPRKVYFNDQRRFGTLKAVFSDDEMRAKLDTLGPDMLDAPALELFISRMRKIKQERQIAEALLDQRIVSGVGNYIRAEGLYRAKLSPFRKISELTDYDLSILRDSIILVMRESYEARGNSFSTYRTADGKQGNFKDFLRVYGRKHDPFGSLVTRELADDGRAVWWCKDVQR